MADITLYKPAASTIVVIDGVPPVDQSALVASLTAQVASLQATLVTRTAERDSLQVKVNTALVSANATVTALS